MKSLGDELVDAASSGDLGSVEQTLSLGADVHALDDFALRLASMNGHVGVVEVLLRAGADVHVQDDYALHYACYYGCVSVVVKLVEVGADLGVLQNGWVDLFGCDAPRGLVKMSTEKVVGLLLAEVVRRELV